jgi:carbonic anhydrase/acetyltransferase-like protein (isoleucine patch superfamily)
VILEHRGARPTIDPSAYVAPTAVVYGDVTVGAGAPVLIGPHAHVDGCETVLAPDTVVPIGWIAAGDPARLFGPGQHEELWAVQRDLDFPGTVYGVERGTPPAEPMALQSEFFGAHREDRECG